MSRRPPQAAERIYDRHSSDGAWQSYVTEGTVCALVNARGAGAKPAPHRTLNAHLNGSIPAELGLLTNVTALSLDDNHLSGSIPDDIGRLSALVFLCVA